MSTESQIREAIIGELERQAENSGSQLRVETGEDRVVIHVPVDLDDLVMVILGSVAGGP